MNEQIDEAMAEVGLKNNTPRDKVIWTLGIWAQSGSNIGRDQIYDLITHYGYKGADSTVTHFLDMYRAIKLGTKIIKSI